MSTFLKVKKADSGDELKINSGYANNYNSWRQKEELNKFKTKYGEHVTSRESSGEDSETSSDEDEEGTELTEEFEKNFYKTLACLKNKDPKIYDDKVMFFDEATKNSETSTSSKKSSKEKKLFLRDYERSIVLERGGKLSDSEDEDTFHRKKRESREPTYVEEQLALKESISKVIDDDDDDGEDNEENDLLIPKPKTESENFKDDETYRDWLKGQKAEIDNDDEAQLKPLRDFWIDPKLDPNEKFLRDYVLNKKFVPNEATDDNVDYEQIAHDSDENLSEDEKNIVKQEEFEHKYNFRFEEPDQEFIKRYPRTLENSLRKKDNRRAQRRAEIKQRKDGDKIRKQEELKQLKALKRKEIADKIAKLREITGNDDIQFANIDLDGDFDPAEHDRRMKEIFNEEYYAIPENDLKPEFPDIDEELGIERSWDDYDPENEEFVPENDLPRVGNSHCEDPQFNMDADYDPTRSMQNELVDSSRKKKKRRRSKFAEIIAKEKPKFDPNLHSSYQDYIEQYYALDYEDMIDDLPCRFKYRKVVPNDYGLSVEEILTADDRELNKWCSLKKALEHKPENIELNEVRIYQQKSMNEAYKKKILKSLYAPEEEPQNPETVITAGNGENDDTEKRKRKKKKKKKKKQPSGDDVASTRVKIDKNGKVETNELSVRDGKILNDEISKKVKILKKEKIRKKDKMEEKIVNDSPVDLRKNEIEIISKMKSPAERSKKRKASEKQDISMGSLKLKTNEPPVKKIKVENKISPEAITASSTNKIMKDKKKRKKNGNIEDFVENSRVENFVKNPINEKRSSVNNKKKKQSSSLTIGKKFKKTMKKETDQMALLSSERLKAYGLNPKKFKNQLKYGKR